MQTNNYQVIVVSDGSQTYAVFSYICNQIGWTAPPGSNQSAVVGYYNRGNFYNHPHSGLQTIGERVSCPLSAKRKRTADEPSSSPNVEDCLMNNDDTSSECIMLKMKRDNCNLYNSMVSFFFFSITKTDAANRLTEAGFICPPSNTIAVTDSRFSHQTDNCYVSNTIEVYGLVIIGSIYLGQQCCYSERYFDCNFIMCVIILYSQW